VPPNLCDYPVEAREAHLSLAYDLLDIMAAYYYKGSLDQGYIELPFTTPEKLNDEVSDWKTATGQPSRLYIDRKRGDMDTVGVYPIPDVDGNAIAFTNPYASELTWICPLYVPRWDFGRILRYSSDDTFIVSSSDTALVDAEVSDGNILIEYYRLPYQRGEVPAESAKAVSMFAAADLLSDNPEDSAEFKRSQALMGQFTAEVAMYVNRRKRPVAAQDLRAIPAVWAWQKNMPYYKGLR